MDRKVVGMGKYEEKEHVQMVRKDGKKMIGLLWKSVEVAGPDNAHKQIIGKRIRWSCGSRGREHQTTTYVIRFRFLSLHGIFLRTLSKDPKVAGKRNKGLGCWRESSLRTAHNGYAKLLSHGHLVFNLRSNPGAT